METQTELQSLQNAADFIGLTVYVEPLSDKRKSIKRYHLCKDKRIVSPVFDYEQMNCYILGWINALRHNEQ